MGLPSWFPPCGGMGQICPLDRRLRGGQTGGPGRWIGSHFCGTGAGQDSQSKDEIGQCAKWTLELETGPACAPSLSLGLQVSQSMAQGGTPWVESPESLREGLGLLDKSYGVDHGYCHQQSLRVT